METRSSRRQPPLTPARTRLPVLPAAPAPPGLRTPSIPTMERISSQDGVKGQELDLRRRRSASTNSKQGEGVPSGSASTISGGEVAAEHGRLEAGGNSEVHALMHPDNRLGSFGEYHPRVPRHSIRPPRRPEAKEVSETQQPSGRRCRMEETRSTLEDIGSSPLQAADAGDSCSEASDQRFEDVRRLSDAANYRVAVEVVSLNTSGFTQQGK